MAIITLPFNLLPGKWGSDQSIGTSGGEVTYSFATENISGQFADFDSFIDESSFQDDIVAAFGSWEDIANIRFSLVPDTSSVDIRLGWANIDGPGNILGDTSIPSSGPLNDVIIRFDRNEDWITGGVSGAPETINFNIVALHEIGHAIGIDHSNEASALMSSSYNPNVVSIQDDDVAALQAIYGESNIEKINVVRYQNTERGGHFFSASFPEQQNLQTEQQFIFEGIGFKVLARDAVNVEASVPVYRFFNDSIGTHFYTASESEKNAVLEIEGLQFENVVFRVFEKDFAATTPVYRFFNTLQGGHFYTASEVEKESVLGLADFRFEGVGFYAYESSVDF